MRTIYPIILSLFISAAVWGRDMRIKWDGLPVNDPAKMSLPQAVERDYFKALDKAHLARPNLLIVHCYTAGMAVQDTRVVIGTIQDEVWLSGADVRQLERELTIMLFLRKQVQKEGRLSQ